VPGAPPPPLVPWQLNGGGHAGGCPLPLHAHGMEVQSCGPPPVPVHAVPSHSPCALNMYMQPGWGAIGAVAPLGAFESGAVRGEAGPKPTEIKNCHVVIGTTSWGITATRPEQ
jgi:hypothetical protein